MFSSRTLTDHEIPDFDIREDFLEDHWGDEVQCEGHNDTVPVACSVHVTHLFLSCTEPVLICEALAEYVKGPHKVSDLCGDCDRPCTDCWSAVAI